MKYYLTPLIAKKPDNLFLHVGTNNAIDETSETIFDRITTLVQFINPIHAGEGGGGGGGFRHALTISTVNFLKTVM